MDINDDGFKQWLIVVDDDQSSLEDLYKEYTKEKQVNNDILFDRLKQVMSEYCSLNNSNLESEILYYIKKYESFIKKVKSYESKG